MKAEAAIGQKPDAAFSDPLPMVMTATIYCMLSDGTRIRYIVTGPSRASTEVEIGEDGRTVSFHFRDTIDVQEAKFDA